MLGSGLMCVNSRAGLPNIRQSRAKLIAAVGESATPPPLPPFCSDCATKTQSAGGGAPTQSGSRVWRASDGKYRLDTPKISIISDPRSQQAIVLDHLKKEAMIIPMAPKAPGMAAPPSAPQVPAAQGQAAPVKVEDLGKSMIEGHEVEGKRFTLPPFSPPKMPAMPGAPQAKAPGLPAAPSLSSVPKAPAVPTLPKVPSVTEIWTSTKLKTPVLTKVATAAGEQTTYCKPMSTDEPHPSVFQIPQGYKLKPPKA